MILLKIDMSTEYIKHVRLNEFWKGYYVAEANWNILLCSWISSRSDLSKGVVSQFYTFSVRLLLRFHFSHIPVAAEKITSFASKTHSPNDKISCFICNFGRHEFTWVLPQSCHIWDNHLKICLLMVATIF